MSIDTEIRTPDETVAPIGGGAPPAPDGLGLRVDELEAFRRYRFHQLIELLSERFGPDIEHEPSGEPRGRFRFRAARSLSFGASDIAELSYDEDREELEVRVNFFGLYGPASPLPAHFTERIIEEDQTPSAVEDLCDLFNHRLTTLLHDIWRKYRYYLRYSPGATDALSQRFLALSGFPIEDRDHIGNLSRTALLPHLGLLSLYSSSGDVVASALSNFFNIPCRIEEYVERRVVIEDGDRTRLGMNASALGEDIVLGRELEDDHGKFRICLGPGTYDELAPLIPGGACHDQLTELLAMICREPLEWDLQFEFDAESVPTAKLGECRLGWSSWAHASDAAGRENTVVVSVAGAG